MMNPAVSRKLAINVLWAIGLMLCLLLPKAAFAENLYSQSYAYAQCQQEKARIISYHINGFKIEIDCVLTITAAKSDAYWGLYTFKFGYINSQYGTWDEQGSVFGYLKPSPTDAAPDSSCCTSPQAINPFKADPINATLGNKTETVVEYAGTGPFPLTFAWTYNSLAIGLIQTADSPAIGLNRSHNYQRNIQVVMSGTVDGVNTAYVKRADGSIEPYQQSGTSWIANADNDNILIALLDGQSNITGWEHHLSSGDVEYYGSDGSLTRITNRAGLSQTLGYDTSGRLSTVTDAFGRSLVFLISVDPQPTFA